MRFSQIFDALKLILAGLFVFASLLFPIAFVGNYVESGAIPFYIFVPAQVAFSIAVGIGVFILFNHGQRSRRDETKEEHLRDLEEEQLLTRDDFVATRAFSIAEFEDEGSHYFLELTDGRVLFMTGQYLYDYEPISDDGNANQPRKFPCTDFTVVRHKTKGYVIDIDCRGSVLEPELEAPHFYEKLWDEFGIGDDLTLITTESYDSIKSRCLASK